MSETRKDSVVIILPAFREQVRNQKSILASFIAAEEANSKEGLDFAFLVHPRDPYDALACTRFIGINPSFLACFFSQEREQWLKNHLLYRHLASIPPFFVRDSQISVSGVETTGGLAAVLLYGEQMLSNGWRSFAKERITESVVLAQERGARLVGLGAHTSPATLGGRLLIESRDRLAKGVGITNGNALTAAMSVEQAKRAVTWLELNPEQSKVGIVGATGSVGSATARLLAEEGYRLVLNGRSENKLKSAFRDLMGVVQLSANLEDMRQCDVVMVMTSSTTATVKPEHIRPGTFIIEDTQPRNISASMARDIENGGSLVIDGGFVHIPGYRCGFNLRLPEEVTFACLAETLLLAAEGRFSDYSIGDAEVSKAREIMTIAEKYGATVAPPTWNSAPVKAREIQRVKENNRRYKNPPSYSVSQQIAQAH